MAQLPGSELHPGTTMHPGDFILSPDQSCQLTMQRGGDLTFGATGQQGAPWIWHSQTNGAHPSCTMSPNGDLQIHAGGKLISHSATTAANGYLRVHNNDENIIDIVNEDGMPLVMAWVNGAMCSPDAPAAGQFEIITDVVEVQLNT